MSQSDDVREIAEEIVKQVAPGKIHGTTCKKLGKLIAQALQKERDRIKKACKVGFDCGHAKQDVLGGDCVHCNLLVCEGANEELQAKNKELEGEVRALKSIIDETHKLMVEAETENKELQAQVEQSSELRHRIVVGEMQKEINSLRLRLSQSDAKNKELQEQVERLNQTIQKIDGVDATKFSLLATKLTLEQKKVAGLVEALSIPEHMPDENNCSEDSECEACQGMIARRKLLATHKQSEGK